MAESLIQKIVSTFTDREHLRQEIPARILMAEIAEMRQILRTGQELVRNPDTLMNELRPVGETRLKEISLLWNIDFKMLSLVIPTLKPIGVTVAVPELSKEDMEPQNIRPKMLEHVIKGNITPEAGEQICKVAGATEVSADEEDEPIAFEVNLNLVDARVERDEHGIIIEPADEEEDDVGDVFRPVGG